MDYSWVIEMIYQLFGLSFWRHPFTAKHPLGSKWCNAQYPQFSSDEETNASSSWLGCGVVEYIFISILGELFTLSLKCFIRAYSSSQKHGLTNFSLDLRGIIYIIFCFGVFLLVLESKIISSSCVYNIETRAVRYGQKIYITIFWFFFRFRF